MSGRAGGLLAGMLLAITALGCISHAPADLVLTNGKIVTVDPELGEVEALASRNGRIIAVGDAQFIAGLIGPDTQVLDLHGRTAIPGFIEGHAHFTGMGEAARNLDLSGVDSWDEVVTMVAEAARRAKPGEWILGRGWHQEKWSRAPQPSVEGFPTHHALSAVSPENPVCLRHASGHACFFNQKAMELAGVDSGTGDPEGGEILKDEAGQPIGIFRETAQALVGRAHMKELAQRTQEEAEADLRQVIRLADQECLSKGVTSFQDAGSPFSTVDVMKKMAQEGKLGTRLWVMIRDSNSRLAEKLPAYRMTGVGEDRLTVRAIKRTLDGALGSRGAWLLTPYTDSPESTGLATASIESVTETARLAAIHGFQLCVHAIGDRANREVLDLYEKTLKEHSLLKDHRWRVEHAQHLHPSDIPRFAGLGVIASMQGVHCTSDGPWVTARLGEERARTGAYVWRRLIESGALVTNGTDAPVEDVDPLKSYYASVTRRMPDGSAFYPDQKMSRIEALQSYTIHCARAAFEEQIKGSLTPGKLADIVVLTKDILTVPEEEILDTRVLMTIVGGKLLYLNEDATREGFVSVP